MPARSMTSASRGPIGPYAGCTGAGPSKAAVTTNPMTLTEPASVTSTDSGLSRPWCRPCACAAAIASATSRVSQAARVGGRVLRSSMMSSETPSPHSLTTQVNPSTSSQSSTRR
jgi:hypothetical protein